MDSEKKKRGRPNTYWYQEDRMDNYNLRITAKHARRARKEGNGNLSLGVRIAIEKLDDLHKED